MSVYAVIVAAGAGTRMGMAKNKVLFPLAGKCSLLRAAEAFSGLVEGVVVVAAEGDLAEIRQLLPSARVAPGGNTRQRSVLSGLLALPPSTEVVLVHDAARPFVSREVIRACIASAREKGSGVAAVPVKDTVKVADENGMVRATPSRQTLYAVQTPQGFPPQTLRRAIEALEARGETATDDAGAVEALGAAVYLVPGAYDNIKLTTQEDLWMAEAFLGREASPPSLRAGHGYDVHRLAEGRPLVLCGITVPYEKGLLGHSDADVGTHALMDALLGAAGLGDIGVHFPDSDPRYKGASSIALLERVAAMLSARGLAPGNVDVTLVLERPKLRPYIPEMTEMLARILGIDEALVNIKATTTEGLGFEGEGLGVSAHAVVTLRRIT